MFGNEIIMLKYFFLYYIEKQDMPQVRFLKFTNTEVHCFVSILKS